MLKMFHPETGPLSYSYKLFNDAAYLKLRRDQSASLFLLNKQFNDEDYEDDKDNGPLSQDSFEDVDEETVPEESNGIVGQGKRLFLGLICFL